MRDELAVFSHEIDDRGMIDGVVAGCFFIRDDLIKDAIRLCRVFNVLLASGQAD